jgi:hypothetical protein
MASGHERGKQERPQPTVGYVSRHAQQRVDKRVMEIMSRRDGRLRREPPSAQAMPARRA